MHPPIATHRSDSTKDDLQRGKHLLQQRRLPHLHVAYPNPREYYDDDLSSQLPHYLLDYVRHERMLQASQDVSVLLSAAGRAQRYGAERGYGGTLAKMVGRIALWEAW